MASVIKKATKWIILYLSRNALLKFDFLREFEKTSKRARCTHLSWLDSYMRHEFALEWSLQKKSLE